MQQKERYDSTAKSRNFVVAETVLVRNYSRGAKWLPGVIVKRTGPVSFLIKLPDGQVWRRHRDQMRKSNVRLEMEPQLPEADVTVDLPSVAESTPIYSHTRVN